MAKPGIEVRGVLWMLAAACLFSAADSLVKVATQSFPAVEIVWARLAFHFLFMLLLMHRRLVATWTSRAPVLQLTRSALLALATILLTLGLSIMPVADLTAVMFVTPLFVSIFSIPLLGERVGARHWIGLAAGFCGALVILRPGLGILQSAVLLPISASCCYALYQIYTRKAGAVDGAMTSLLWTPVVGFVVLAFIVYPTWVAPDAWGWGLLAAIGTVSGTSQYCLIRAVQAAPASAVAPYLYSGLIWATLFGYLLFGDFPDAWTFAGAALIILSGLVILRRGAMERA